MAMAKKDRFERVGLQEMVGGNTEFPPTEFSYNGVEYTTLGKSNLTTLLPLNITSSHMQSIVTDGKLSQFVCTDALGNIFEACFYQEDNRTYLYAIGTRERPEK